MVFKDIGMTKTCLQKIFRHGIVLQVVQRRQTAVGYVNMLQNTSMMTEGPRLCGDGWLFQQDSAAIHRARYTLTFLQKTGSIS